MNPTAWKITDRDDVAIILEDIASGGVVRTASGELTALQDIPQGHKIADRDIRRGELVKKYGVVIGRASQDIKAGEHVHTHNLEDITEALCKEYYKEFTRRGESR